MPYNIWYSATYEAIIDLADWSTLNADIEKKIITIFAWMPMTIMAVRHRGSRFKFELYSPQKLNEELALCADRFRPLFTRDLIDRNFSKEEESILREVCRVLFLTLGTVAGSKFLHFSAPKLIPMWDRKIRIGAQLDDSVDGFLSYVQKFRDELQCEQNRKDAAVEYASNLIRGWDIVRMKHRARGGVS